MATYTACQDYCKDQHSTAQYIGYLGQPYKWLPKGLCMCKSALDEDNKVDIEGYVAGTVDCVEECEKNVGYGNNVVGSTEGMATYTACQDYCKDQYSTAQYFMYVGEDFYHLKKGHCTCQSAKDEDQKVEGMGYIGMAGTVDCAVAGK